MTERIAQVRAFVVAAEAAPTTTTRRGGHWITARSRRRWRSIRSTARRESFGINVLGSVVVEVESESRRGRRRRVHGRRARAFLVERHLARFVEGERADRIELMWDRMWRASLFYGRKGLAVNAISAVDLALWDLLGRLRGEPVSA